MKKLAWALALLVVVSSQGCAAIVEGAIDAAVDCATEPRHEERTVIVEERRPVREVVVIERERCRR